MSKPRFTNPFRPGAGHPPPYLAGRQAETDEFVRLLDQQPILQNLVLTGLRGVGKTVLLDSWKPLAQHVGWRWTGSDLSESASLNEERMATRILTDLSLVTSAVVVKKEQRKAVGFKPPHRPDVEYTLNYELLMAVYNNAPGLVADKLQRTLEFTWNALESHSVRGVVFAYDEGQNIADHPDDREYPLSLLLQVFQSLQKKGAPFLLLLAGLPTLFPKMVKARTFAERMFHVVFLDRLSDTDAREAIVKPIQVAHCPVEFAKTSVDAILELSGGYPYFIQFICRESYDVFVQQHARGENGSVPREEIVRKLDADFFSGRWARATDRQRALLHLIADLPSCDQEFTVAEIVAASNKQPKKSPGRAFSPSHVSQMLSTLGDAGLVYRNRHGKYSFAVPLLGKFIKRQPAAV